MEGNSWFCTYKCTKSLEALRFDLKTSYSAEQGERLISATGSLFMILVPRFGKLFFRIDLGRRADFDYFI